MALGGVSNVCGGAIVRLCEDGMVGNCRYGSGEAGGADAGDGAVDVDGVAAVVVEVCRSFGCFLPAR